MHWLSLYARCYCIMNFFQKCLSHITVHPMTKTFASQSSFLTSQFWNSPTVHPTSKNICFAKQFLTSQFWNLPHFHNSQTQLIVFLNVDRARGSNSKSLMSDNPGCYKPSYSDCGVCSKCFKIKYICYCPEKWRNILTNVILLQ